MTNQITLRKTRDDKGSRFLGASLNQDGALVIEGQDLGRGVEDFFGGGNSEYEWAWTIHAKHHQALLAALGEPADADVLQVLLAHFAGENAAEVKPFLDKHKIEYTSWSRVGD